MPQATREPTLVIPGAFWRTIVEMAIRSPERIHVGPCGRHAGAAGERILVRHLEDLPQSALPERLARWSDLAVVHVGAAPPWRGRDGTEALSLTSQHRLAVASLGVNDAAGQVGGRLWDGRRWTRLAGISIAGAGQRLLPLSPGAEPSALSEAAPLERFSRTMGALTPLAWERLRALRIAVLGAGRSGSLAAHLLVLEGAASHLSLIDGDALELSNLDGVFGLRSTDVGRPKAPALAERLRELRSDLVLEGAPVWAQDRRALEALREADVIISTVDREAARLAAGLVASAYLRIHLDIGTGIHRAGRTRRMGADVRLLLPGDGACIRCAGGFRDEDAARAELLLGTEALQRRRMESDWRAERAGSLATVNAVAVGCALTLLGDLLEGRVQESRWLRLEWDEEGRLAAQPIPVRRTEGCPVCGEPGLGDYRFG